ncbi:IclR family transcriptional regulator [Paradesulfitobacterium aromaticivorans]
MKNSTKYLIHSVEKACDILLAFDEENLEYGVTELSKRLNLTKSTVHKLLLTFEHKGLIFQNPDNGKYSLSLKIFQLANLYLDKLEVKNVVKPYMERLSEKFNETVHFAVLDEDEVVYIEKIEGKQAVNIYSRIGRRSPLHCPGVGKAILACLPPEQVQRIVVRKGLKAFTPYTITDIEALQAELNRIRATGYAIDNEEYEAGIRCAAVPVKNSENTLIGAISVTGPANRMTDERLREIAKELLAGVDEIKHKLVNKTL